MRRKLFVESCAPVNISVPTQGYVASAVHWDGTSYLHNDTLACGAHNKLSFAVWFQITEPIESNVDGFWITDPASFNFSYGEANRNTGMQFTLIDVDQTTYLATARTVFSGTEPAAGIWYVYMGSADVSSNSGKIVAYLGDIDASGDEDHPTTNLGGPGAVIQGDGVPMRVGDSDPIPRGSFDMANFLMWYGSAIDWSVQANRRFIIDSNGKPVDPALAIAQFGTPTVALIGDHTAFQTNQGSGGAFALSGTLTDATTSPSD